MRVTPQPNCVFRALQSQRQAQLMCGLPQQFSLELFLENGGLSSSSAVEAGKQPNRLHACIILSWQPLS